MASNLNDFNNRSSSAWSSSASATPPPPESRPKAAFDLKLLHKNDLSKNSNVDFANFANVFQNTNSTTSAFDSLNSNAFLDKSNNNNGRSNNNDTSDLFADFNDNFGAAAAAKTKKDTEKGAFDPFGVSTSSSTSSSSASKNNNHGASPHHFAATFDDDPFGEQPLTTAAVTKVAKDTENNNNAMNMNINFGGGARSNGVGDLVAMSKKKDKTNNHSSGNKNTPAATSTAKYSEDYSKNFDTDLEEVLKRSLFDQ